MSNTDSTSTPPGQGTAGSTDVVTQLQNIVRQLSAIAGATSSGGIPLPLSLANGGLGGDQSGAAEAQVPVYPGSGGAAVPRSLGYANVVWYGADPTGTNDCSAAVNAALTASPCIYFPPGKYKFLSSLTYTIPAGINSISILGSGQEVTILNFPTGQGINIIYNSATSTAHVRDFTITTGTTNAGSGLRLTGPSVVGDPAIFDPSDITRITTRGGDGLCQSDYWTRGIEVIGVSNVNFDGVVTYGAGNVGGYATLGTGIHIHGTSAATPVAFQITNSMLNFIGVGIRYGDYAQGILVAQTQFTGCSAGIAKSAATNGDELAVINCQFNCATFGIDTQAAVAPQVSNCFFIIPAAATGGIVLSNETTAIVYGNIFEGLVGNSANAIVFHSLGSGDAGLKAQNNVITGMSVGIWLQAGTVLADIQGNTFVGNNTNIFNQSTAVNNIIANNPGYNPVGVSVPATVGASPSTITNGPTPATYYFLQSATNTATVAQGGQTLGTLSSATLPLTVDLGPNESVIVTWATTAPTYTVSVH